MITVIEDNICVPGTMRIVEGTVLSVAEWPEFRRMDFLGRHGDERLTWHY